jgi:hypothetical protein
MIRDKPIIVLVSHPVVVFFSTTDIHTSSPNSRIVLLAKVIDAELWITFFHNLDIWIRMDWWCVATKFANLDVEHEKRRVQNPTIFRMDLTRRFRHGIGTRQLFGRVGH